MLENSWRMMICSKRLLRIILAVLISSLSLPSSLEDRLMIIFADYDGSYEDHRMTRQYIPRTILRTVRRIQVGQKVLIIEEDDGKDRDESYGNARKEKRIWSVQLSAFGLLLTT